ncbi:MAG: transposase [Phycisphaerales bacterium]
MHVDAPFRRRLRRWEAEDRIRFVTFSCHRRLPLLTNHRICRLLLDGLERVRTAHAVQVIAWVFMPEHVHMLVRPGPTVALGTSLRSMKMAVSKRVIARWRTLDAPILNRVASRTGPRFWQAGGGFDRNVRDEEELTREIRYIHENPVERGLVARPELWPWSSIRWWMGARDGEFPCCYPRGLGWEKWQGYVSRNRTAES